MGILQIDVMACVNMIVSDQSHAILWISSYPGILY
jgi:hypothetical protein